MMVKRCGLPRPICHLLAYRPVRHPQNVFVCHAQFILKRRRCPVRNTPSDCGALRPIRASADSRQAEPSTLFFEDFLHLAYFLLDFPAYLFDLAFGFQVGIVRRSSNLLFNFTFQLVKLSFCFVLSALPHGLSPLTRSICESSRRAFNRQSICKHLSLDFRSILTRST